MLVSEVAKTVQTPDLTQIVLAVDVIRQVSNDGRVNPISAHLLWHSRGRCGSLFLSCCRRFP
jgi:hypothetical protein